MKLKVLGSGSSGNSYILESDKEALVIEAGLPLKEVKIALGFNISKIAGVVVSHSHGDHAKYVAEYEKAGIKAFKPYVFCGGDEDSMEWTRAGRFYIKAFSLVHDVLCFGFYIGHPDIGTLVYASDTEYIKWRFRNANHILVEANYSDELIDYEAVNRNHVLQGHMSLQTVLNFIKTNDNPALKNVVLIHLSDNNGDPVKFQQKTKEILKYGADVYIAEKGLTINLDILPF